MKPLTDPRYGPRHNVKIRPAPGNWTCPLCKYEVSLFFISTAHLSKIQHVGLLKNNKYKTQYRTHILTVGYTVLFPVNGSIKKWCHSILHCKDKNRKWLDALWSESVGSAIYVGLTSKRYVKWKCDTLNLTALQSRSTYFTGWMLREPKLNHHPLAFLKKLPPALIFLDQSCSHI